MTLFEKARRLSCRASGASTSRSVPVMAPPPTALYAYLHEHLQSPRLRTLLEQGAMDHAMEDPASR